MKDFQNTTKQIINIIENTTEQTLNKIENATKHISNEIINATERTLNIIKNASERTSNATENAANWVYSLIQPPNLQDKAASLFNEAKEPENAKEGRTAIHLAATKGDISLLKYLIANYPALLKKDNMGQTALHLAAQQGHHETVDRLVKLGTNVNEDDLRGETALHYAAQKGHHETVARLVKLGSNVHKINLMGKTALHLAAIYGHHETVARLVKLGSKSVKDQLGKLPLHYAVQNKNYKVISALATVDDDLTQKDFNSNTPLSTAKGKKDNKLLNTLLFKAPIFRASAKGLKLWNSELQTDLEMYLGFAFAYYQNVLGVYIPEELIEKIVDISKVLSTIPEKDQGQHKTYLKDFYKRIAHKPEMLELPPPAQWQKKDQRYT